MNIPRLLLAILVGFVFVFASDFVIHALWLAPDYAATSALWRLEPEMQRRFGWMLLGQLLCALAFTVLWARGFAGRSLKEGAIFGFFMGLSQQVWAIALYVVAPLPGFISAKWFASGVLQAIILGIILATLYKSAPRKT